MKNKEYIPKFIKYHCKHCDRPMEVVLWIYIGESTFEPPFVKQVFEFCKCGHKPTLDELIEHLDSEDCEGY